ncbi:uncharacterized protein isoform X3 [Danio rerio]|uniref:Uncharacterized protein isoform X3 n=1 Tax=Danio rerio TaxID=7955 RepID=A0AC58JQ05_DANRE|nr:uncharacterized protein LOC108190430 isoform X3 [Danio rerio]XP_021332936.1 uncharacterized protein LOC108190430 isoform X3 [Danio rerio]|eukprot:XP_017212190.1 uncharacterized protein LOC108190430 isoform X3 [Danio rerio]
MLHHFLVHAAFQTSRWLPKDQRLKFQVVLFVFVVLFLTPQFYVLSRPKSSRYCEKPLLNNLIVFIVFSFIATDPVPKTIRAAFHTFGLFSFIEGLCTVILTLTAPQCANTTTELYIFSLVASWACIFSTAFFVVRGGLCLVHKLFPHWLRDACLWD